MKAYKSNFKIVYTLHLTVVPLYFPSAHINLI